MHTRTLGTGGLTVSAIGAADIVLSGADLAEIDRAAAAIEIEGERYPAHLLATTGR